MSTVSAVIRRRDTVLLVGGRDADPDGAGWYLPGGKVEPGESLHDALRREVAEETGLRITDHGQLAWVGQVTFDDPDPGEGVFFVFAVPDPGGTPMPADPDSKVTVAEFAPVEIAIQRLSRLAWPRMRDPAVTYLRGHACHGTTWIYRRHGDEDDQLAVLPPLGSTAAAS